MVARSMPVSAPGGSTVPEAALPFGGRNALPEEEQFLLQPQAADSPLEGLVTPLGVSRPITSAAKYGGDFWTGTAGGGIYKNGNYCVYSGRTVYALHKSAVIDHQKLYASITLESGDPTVIRKAGDTGNDPCNWDGDSTGIPTTTRVNGFASTNNRLFATSSSGVYFYDEQNQRWIQGTNLSDPAYSLAFDPDNPNLLYAATWNGAFISTDGGLNWTQAPKAELQGREFFSVQVDANNPNIVYFGSKDGSTYRWDKTLP
jgi:hypothetical protein